MLLKRKTAPLRLLITNKRGFPRKQPLLKIKMSMMKENLRGSDAAQPNPWREREDEIPSPGK